MIKFFRKIRQRLLTENKFTKYLLYAIGEIVLVVVGILIALTVNNQNEIKKNNTTIKQIFEEVLNDLEYNIQLADKQIENTQAIDSLCNRILSKQVIIEDYGIGSSYDNLMFSASNFCFDELIMNASELLMLKLEIVPEQYKEEFNLIKEINKNDIEDISYYITQLEKYTSEIQNEYRQNYDWFSNSKEVHSTQRINFQLKNAKYFNNVKFYKHIVGFQHGSYNVFRTNAIIAYHQIHKKNNSLREIPEYIPSFLKATPEELSEYIGAYGIDRGKSLLSFTIEKFYLKVEVSQINNQYIYKVSKDVFMDGGDNNIFMKFKRDSIGIVESFDLIEGGEFRANFKRIKN